MDFVLIHDKMEKQKQSNQWRFSLAETYSAVVYFYLNSKLLYGLGFKLMIRRVNYEQFSYCLTCKTEWKSSKKVSPVFFFNSKTRPQVYITLNWGVYHFCRPLSWPIKILH